MNKLNNHGFGVVEGLLVLVIIGLIGGAGFYVYKSTQNTNASLNNADNSSVTPRPTMAQKNPYDNWKIHKSPTEKLSFKYPSDWSYSDVSKANPTAGDSIILTSPSNNIEVNWVSFRTGLGGGCTSENTTVSNGNVKMTLGDCPYFFVQDKQKINDANLYAVFGVKTLDGDKYVPWCALQDDNGILNNMSAMGYLLFQGKNNDDTRDGVNRGPVSAGLRCNSNFETSTPGIMNSPLDNNKQEASKFWDTTEGNEIKLILKSASYN